MTDDLRSRMEAAALKSRLSVDAAVRVAEEAIEAATVEWPEWLTPEYGAIHTRIVNSMKRGAQSVYDSADGAGMDYTASGMRSVQASSIIADLRRDGWVPPAAAIVPVDEIGDPQDHSYAEPDEECEICGEVDWLREIQTLSNPLNVCDGCAEGQVPELLKTVREVRAELAEARNTIEALQTPCGNVSGIYRCDLPSGHVGHHLARVATASWGYTRADYAAAVSGPDAENDQ